MKIYSSSYEYKGHKIYDKDGYWYIREEVGDGVYYPHFATDEDAEEYIDNNFTVSEEYIPRYFNIDYINSMFLDSASCVGYNDVEADCLHQIEEEYPDITIYDIDKIERYLDRLLANLTEKDFSDIQHRGNKLPVVYTGDWLE